ncbi:MAG TPA: hemerythrin domain-containing protein [Acidimicrobiia bacterium]|nr:hemerythrin domain-containing protein [Acidimicrobiia bacterium]
MPSETATEIAPASTDVVTVLTGQHDLAREILAELHETVAAVAEITQDMAGPFRRLVALLAAHEAAEELVVYPALRTKLQKGILAGEIVAEEDEARRRLARLEKLAAGFFAFPDALAEFEEAILAHAAHEEQAVFPILEAGLPAAERARLGADVRYAEAKAPSHAHAHSPHGAVGHAVLDPVIATLDRFRDAVRN